MRSVKKNNELFTIDDLGNRTQVNLRNGSNENYVVNNTTNYYTSIDGNTIGYDDAGNMTADKDGYKYYYDYENRLVKVTKSSGPEVTVAEYAYDALGRRIRKIDSIGSETTLYYYNNNWQVVTEANSVGDTARYFVYGNFIDELLMMHDCSADEDYYACQDHLYSNVALVGQNGTVVERYEYDAYGKPTIYNADFTQTYSDSQYGNCYMFTGRRLDTLDNSGLKLQYNRNRYYNSEMGRWLTRDPIGYPDGMNP
ncbi:MAG: hypothetical protein ISS77_08295 [Phycisphaerae bacterium]|nr:hypothetical protein [Phycisphaerae bacterium]